MEKETQPKPSMKNSIQKSAMRKKTAKLKVPKKMDSDDLDYELNYSGGATYRSHSKNPLETYEEISGEVKTKPHTKTKKM